MACTLDQHTAGGLADSGDPSVAGTASDHARLALKKAASSPCGLQPSPWGTKFLTLEG